MAGVYQCQGSPEDQGVLTLVSLLQVFIVINFWTIQEFYPHQSAFVQRPYLT